MRFPESASAVARVFTPWRGAPTALSRSAWHSIIATLAVAVVLAGCGVRLAPNYDRSIIDGLGRANEETMTLFATVASGAPKNTFPARSQTYDELIGKFDALRLEAQVRPSPQTPAAATLISATTRRRSSRSPTRPPRRRPTSSRPSSAPSR